MSRLWSRFWFAEGSTHLLGLIRLFYGLWVVCKWMGWWGPLQRIHKWRFPRLPVHTRKESDWILEGFNLPLPGFSWLPTPSFEVYQLLQMSFAPLGLLLMLGIATPVVSRLLAGLFFYYLALSQFHYSHHNVILMLVLFVLALAPCGDHYSLDALIRRWRGRVIPAVRSLWSLRMLQILVTAIYLSAAFGKLNDGWFTGRIMEILHTPYHLRGYYAEELFGLVGPKLLAWFTLLVEGGLPLAVWIPAVRLWGILGGVMLHGGIDAMMPVTTFSYQMMTLYIAFLDPRPQQTVVTLPTGRLAGAMGWGIRALNWLDRVAVVRGAGWSVCISGGPAITGAAAVREVALRLPLLMPAAMVLGLPWTLRGRRRSVPPAERHAAVGYS